MLSFLLGRPKCGKSLWAESRLARREGVPAYVGTLPATAEFRDTISAHRVRRGPRWALLELTGVLDEDAAAFLDCIRAHESVLLDGLSVYLLRCEAMLGRRSFGRLRQLLFVLDRAAASSAEVCMVDSHIFPALRLRQRRLIAAAHRAVAERAKSLWVFQNGAAATVAAAEFVRQSAFRPWILPESYHHDQA